MTTHWSEKKTNSFPSRKIQRCAHYVNAHKETNGKKGNKQSTKQVIVAIELEQNSKMLCKNMQTPVEDEFHNDKLVTRHIHTHTQKKQQQHIKTISMSWNLFYYVNFLGEIG